MRQAQGPWRCWASASTTAACPARFARSTAVEPYVCISASAPEARRRRTVGRWPCSAARCSAVFWRKSWSSTLAPAASSARTTSVCPLCAARWRLVASSTSSRPELPMMVFARTAAPRWRRTVTMGRAPASAARWRGVLPAARALGSAFLSRMRAAVAAEHPSHARWRAVTLGMSPMAAPVRTSAPIWTRSSAVPLWAWAAASSSAVIPAPRVSSCTFTFTSAFFLRRASQTGKNPFSAATCSAVRPGWAAAGLAPASSKASTTAAWPPSAARWRGVRPSASSSFTSPPFPTSREREEGSPWAAQMWRAVWCTSPLRVVLHFTSPPCASRSSTIGNWRVSQA
mmetsp:Transcript_17732/g.43006  ORF Transcript_17732/g.43006 Transcript_17732/m.43006 type:complete len:342 (-) Transcript_17732:1446-2471(-)